MKKQCDSYTANTIYWAETTEDLKSTTYWGEELYYRSCDIESQSHNVLGRGTVLQKL